MGITSKFLSHFQIKMHCDLGVVMCIFLFPDAKFSLQKQMIKSDLNLLFLPHFLLAYIICLILFHFGKVT